MSEKRERVQFNPPFLGATGVIEKETVTVTDSNFCIDITRSNAPPVVQWSVADDQPTYRGLMVREFEGSTGTGRRIADTTPNKQWKTRSDSAALGQ